MPRKHPDRLLPDAETRRQWRVAAGQLQVQCDDTLNPTTYVSRWLKFWTSTLEELQRQETWEDRDVRLLAEYVEWCRLADFHARIANADPYTTSDSGRTFAHPGFKLHQEAKVQARVVAERLLLGVELEDDPDAPGSEVGPPPQP